MRIDQNVSAKLRLIGALPRGGRCGLFLVASRDRDPRVGRYVFEDGLEITVLGMLSEEWRGEKVAAARRAGVGDEGHLRHKIGISNLAGDRASGFLVWAR